MAIALALALAAAAAVAVAIPAARLVVLVMPAPGIQHFSAYGQRFSRAGRDAAGEGDGACCGASGWLQLVPMLLGAAAELLLLLYRFVPRHTLSRGWSVLLWC